MENAELTLVIKKRILRIEDRLRGTVEAARHAHQVDGGHALRRASESPA